MEEKSEPDKDRLIREVEFERAGGVDLSSFLTSETSSSPEIIERGDEEEVAELDAAMGDIIEPFISAKNEETVNPSDDNVAPENDVVTRLSIDGERQLNWAMMVAMIAIYSLIGILLGTSVNPTIGGIGLLLLAGYGFWLGERWIPRESMHILGITWVIISMKLLYGLAIDLYLWGWLAHLPLHADIALGTILLALVALNVYIAHHHNSDAVAVQSTLVLMALASGVGSISNLSIEPEIVLAGLLLSATILLHALALMRSSGNLAAVGIVASNLWIGIHALSNDWRVFELQLLTFDNALLLFLLFTFVNIINAVISARFYAEENWFSQALHYVGIGKPGLWGVSVGIGMLGALMTIAAHREQTGYALAQITVLLTAFGGSYLVVRKVQINELYSTMFVPGILLVLALFVLESMRPEGLVEGFANYSLFAMAAAALSSITLLNHQTVVSDVVLWVGCLAVVVLITLLIPADDSADGGLRMLLGVGGCFGGLAILAIKRGSPSMAGISVIGPWVWCLAFATDVDARLVRMDVVPIVLDSWMITGFCVFNTMIQLPVNSVLGDSSINIGSRFKGISEFREFSRDSGIFRLWNLSYLIGLVGWLAMARPASMVSEGLALGIICLVGIHLYSEVAGKRFNSSGLILKTCIIACLIFQFRFGMEGIWPLIISTCGGFLFYFSEGDGEDIITTTMGGLAASSTLFILFSDGNSLPVDIWWPDELTQVSFHLIAAIGFLALYLPKAGNFDVILRPAVASTLMLVALIALASQHNSWLQIIAFGLFLTTGILLVMQAEVRGGIKDLAKRETMKEEIRRKQLTKRYLEDGGRIDDLGDEGIDVHGKDRGTMKVVDSELIALLDKRRRTRRKVVLRENEEEALLSDVHYRPVVMLVFLAAIFAITGYYSFFPSFSGSDGIANAMLVIAALTAFLLVTASRWRSSELGLDLPDILGIEMPLAATMCGLTLVYLLGRMTGEMEDQLALALLCTMLSLFAGFALWGRSDLALRIPSALEWIAYCLVGSSVVGLVLFAAVPPPFFTNPLRYSELIFTGPLAFQEILLLTMVIGWNKVDSMRHGRDMMDHRGVAGRILWLVMIVALSVGPAALLACALGAKRSLDWVQPAVMSIAVIFAWITLYASAVWIENGMMTLVFIIGISGCVASSVGMLWISFDDACDVQWTTCWAWDSHLLGLISVVIIGEVLGDFAISGLVVMFLFLSCIVWVVGIQQDKRTFRVWGAIDLVAAWSISLLYIQVMLEPVGAIIVLTGSAILLGVVTWLAQSKEEILSGDASMAHSLTEDIA